ncbi:hypothetical protein QBC47DRAFT_429498, partial [Echria macrotheca]
SSRTRSRTNDTQILIQTDHLDIKVRPKILLIQLARLRMPRPPVPLPVKNTRELKHAADDFPPSLCNNSNLVDAPAGVLVQVSYEPRRVQHDGVQRVRVADAQFCRRAPVEVVGVVGVAVEADVGVGDGRVHLFQREGGWPVHFYVGVYYPDQLGRDSLEPLGGLELESGRAGVSLAAAAVVLCQCLFYCFFCLLHRVLDNLGVYGLSG